LILFFDSKRDGGYGSNDLYMTKRASRSAPWGEAVNLGPVINTSAYEENAQISTDGSTLYFDVERIGGLGGHDIWQASIKPIVDFNSDGVIDCLDICDLVDHWGTDNSVYDIGPTPFGDRVVDARDLIVLAERMAEDANDADPVE
jgi:hypothetical protein